MKLKDFAIINMGQSPKGETYNTGHKGMPFLQGRKTFGRLYPTIDTWTTSPIKIAKNGEILMSVRAPVGDLNFSNQDVCIGRGLCSISAKNGRNKYLYYVLLNNMKKIRQNSTGTVFSSISKNDLENLEIDFHFDKTQKKIEKILYDIDSKIELNNEINNNLQELINNIFISKFVNFEGYNGDYKTTDLGDIPTEWNIDKLGKVVSFSNGYGWDSKDMLDSEQINTYKVFKMGNIKIGGGINKDKTKSWISKDKCLGFEQYLSKKGDILMCMTDMKSSENPLLGHTALIDRDNEFVINQRVGLVRCNKEIKWPYIYTMTNLPFFISNIRSKAHSGVQVNLTTSGICETMVLVPDNDSLEEFYKNVTPMYEKIFIINNEIEYLQKLRNVLLPKLMNGEIDVENIEI